jgi:hypothetical protein
MVFILFYFILSYFILCYFISFISSLIARDICSKCKTAEVTGAQALFIDLLQTTDIAGIKAM